MKGTLIGTQHHAMSWLTKSAFVKRVCNVAIIQGTLYIQYVHCELLCGMVQYSLVLKVSGLEESRGPPVVQAGFMDC